MSVLVGLVLYAATPLGAQVLPFETLPLKSTPTPIGDQFFFLPTVNYGLAELHVASEDPLLDPFRNPALGAGAQLLRVTVSPTIYHNTLNTLEGASLPVSGTVTAGGWIGAFAWAWQSSRDEPREAFARPTSLNGEVIEDDSRTSSFLLGSLGRRLPWGTSLGVQLARGDIGILTGARSLYLESLGLVQDGDMGWVRVGLAQDLGAGRLDATFSRTRVTVTDEVKRWGWSPPAQPGGSPQVETWTDADENRTVTTEGRVRYTHPVSTLGFRLGTVFGVRDRNQEASPVYDLVNIPRDPGTARLYEIGIGAETLWRAPLFGWEFIYQPGSSDTRALADSTFRDGAVEPGDAALDSHFEFHNWRLAGGMQVPVGSGVFQVGLALHHYAFDLTQEDYMYATTHTRSESWTEMRPSVGARVHVGPVDLGYALRIAAKGTAPCRDYSFRHHCQGAEETFYGTGIPVAPTDPANIPDFRVTSHQLTGSVVVGF